MKGRGILITDGDLLVKEVCDQNGRKMRNGGIQIGNVEKQNQGAIICMHMGEIKEWPTMGVGLPSIILSSDTLLYKHRIRQQFESDDFTISYLNIKVDQNSHIDIQLNATYI